MNNLSLLMYTNEKYIPVAYLSYMQINKYLNLHIKKYLVTNKFLDYNFSFDDFSIIDTSISFCDDASHFREVMYKALKEHILTDYILYFQDDYYVLNYVKTDNFIKLFDYIQSKNIGFLSLYGHGAFNGEIVADCDMNGLPNIIKFYHSYMYSTSVQPCIWNRKFLLDILENNNYLTLSMLDTSNFKNKKGSHQSAEWDYDWDVYGLVFDKPEMGGFAFDEHNGIDDYYLLHYSEIIRHGKFNTHTHRNNKTIVENIIKKHNIYSDNRYKQFI
jgi:hypothetical protein